MEGFFSWESLGTYAGCLGATLVLTQLTKGLWPKKWPTQLLSYLFALATLALALVFAGDFTAESAVLTLFNAAIISLAANGGFDGIREIMEKSKH